MTRIVGSIGRTSGLLAWLRLARVYQHIDRVATEHLRRWGLSMAQFDLLAQVGAAEGLTQGEVARALLVTKGNVCQLVDRMERDGLLRRCQAGRSNQLYLTCAGRTLYEQVVPAHEALIDQLFSIISIDEQARLRTVLRRLDHALKHVEEEGTHNGN